ncbi:MAG TPA: hypothetical protein VMI53_14905 [Opitutaceae bacterium]|nr:hypothetical protein [Opitutaceae bacterium]
MYEEKGTAAALDGKPGHGRFFAGKNHGKSVRARREPGKIGRKVVTGVKAKSAAEPTDNASR